MKTYLKLLLLCALFYSIGQPRAVAVTKTVTICDGTQTNTFVPFWAAYHESGFRLTSQMIYPEDILIAAGLPKGSVIKSIKFRSVSNSLNLVTSNTVTVSAGTTSTSTVSQSTLSNRSLGLTQVFSGTPIASGNYVSFEFNNEAGGVKWDGGCFAVETYISSPNGSNGSNLSWYGKEVNGASSGTIRYTTRTNVTTLGYNANFLPEITISFESSADIPTATITPTSLTFTDVEAGSSAEQNITITNSSDNGLSLVPTLTLTGSGKDYFSFNATELKTLAPRESVTFPVTYSPTTADKTHTAELKLTYVTPGDNPVAGTPVTVSLTGNSVVPRFAATATPAEGTINFGKVIVGGTPARFVIKRAGITNVGTEGWNIPTSNIVTTGDNAFAIVPNQDNTQVDPNGELSFTITFTPTEAKAYEGTLSVTPYEGRTFTWFLMGEGSDAQATMFDNKTYAWPFNADASEQTTSYMSEIATDPDQMIALCRAVYMDQSIPGNINRGYTQSGAKEGTVSYRAVGKVARNHHSDDNQYHIEYVNSYGWDINTNKPIVTSTHCCPLKIVDG